MISKKVEDLVLGGGEPTLSVTFPTPIGPVNVKGNPTTGELKGGGLSKSPASVGVKPETGDVDTKISSGLGPVKVALKFDKYGNPIDGEFTIKPPIPIDVEYSVDDRERKIGETGVRLPDIMVTPYTPGTGGWKGLFGINKALQHCIKKSDAVRREIEERRKRK